MASTDPLDELLRERGPQRSGVGRQRSAVDLDRWRPVVLPVGLVVVVLVVLWSVLAPDRPPEVSLPRAGDQPAGSAVLPDEDGSGAGPAIPPGSAGSATSAVGDDAGGGASGIGTVGGGTGIGGAAATVTVHVAGAVVAPGLVTMPAPARVADALAAAGGPRPDADLDRVNLAAEIADGVRLYLPALGQVNPPSVIGHDTGAGAVDPRTAAGGSSAPNSGSVVNINEADEAGLDALPGVGPATAAAIVSYRAENGPFGSIDELQEVRGIGPAKFEAMADLVTVGP